MKIISFLFNLLVFLTPLAFFPKTSELFEFNKIIIVYLFTILISTAWALESLKRKKIIFKQTPLTLPIILFLLSQTLATIFSVDQRTSLLGYYGRFHGGLLSYTCYAILYFAFVTFMNKKRTIKLINTLLISATIAAIYAAGEHFGRSPSCLVIAGKFDVACWVQDVQARVFGTFGQPNWLAAYLVAVIPIVWAKATNFQTKKHFYLILSLLLYTTLLFTKSRSGLLGFAVSFFIFWPMAFYFFRKNIKKVMTVFMGVAVFVLLATAIWNPLKPNSAPVEGVTESGDIRKIVWQGAFDLWKKYPLLGTGVETFAYGYYETRPRAHNLTSEWNFIYNKAHNEYLNFAATTGAIGLAGYLLLLIFSIKMMAKNLNILKIAVLSGYASILVTNFFGFSTVTVALLLFLFPAISTKAK